MSTDKMRWDFEAWCDAADYSITRVIVGGKTSDSYLPFDTQLAWQAWQASRAALVVELPEKISEHNKDARGYVTPAAVEYDEAIDDCRTAIEAVGVRVKP